MPLKNDLYLSLQWNYVQKCYHLVTWVCMCEAHTLGKESWLCECPQESETGIWRRRQQLQRCGHGRCYLMGVRRSVGSSSRLYCSSMNGFRYNIIKEFRCWKLQKSNFHFSEGKVLHSRSEGIQFLFAGRSHCLSIYPRGTSLGVGSPYPCQNTLASKLPTAGSPPRLMSSSGTRCRRCAPWRRQRNQSSPAVGSGPQEVSLE